MNWRAGGSFIRFGSGVLLGFLALLLGGCSGGATKECPDSDGDGFADAACGGGDCDDGNADVNPNVPEVCNNGVDDDCNPDTPDIFDADGDGDGCDADCDDSDVTVGPSQDEICANGVDDDCNPDTPDTFDADADGDGCDVDCDDSDPSVGPGRAEIACNQVDDDCNPATPDSEDADADGWTNCAGDCEDDNSSVNPGMAEQCANGVDDDCDPDTADVFDGDSDGDMCDVDCDDADPGIGPSKAEICTGGRDEDCDGDIDCLDGDCQNDPACLDCGDGQLQAGEDCDDANTCQYDGCSGCELEQSVVLTSLNLSAGAGFDLDNADGDDNIYTGVDNEFNLGVMYQFLIDLYVNNVINGYIEDGNILQVFTIGDLDNVPFEGSGTPGYEEDPEIVVSGYGGVDPDCPANPSPVPWIDPANAPWSLYSDSDFFSGCEPVFMATDADDTANGIYPANTDPAQPPAPYIHVHAPWMSIYPTSGWVGLLEFYDVYIEASVQNDGSVITAIQDGEIGAILPARSLYSIVTGAPGSTCPTALHAILAFVGQPDQDTEGNGTRDTIDYHCSAFCSSACLSETVTIDGCTDDETGEYIPGSDCVLDPRINDGYSSGFTFSALRTHVTGQVSGSTYCP